MILNNKLSVVTVTFNNADGLQMTLQSIVNCNVKPALVLVIDGGSLDSTLDVIKCFTNALPIVFVSESDSGIYHAMNKGKRMVQSPLVHYLNAGDVLVGDPYLNIHAPCLLSVKVLDPLLRYEWIDSLKLSGFGYCHQGVIFPTNHPEYNEKYELAADFDVITKTFPHGLGGLKRAFDGAVIYHLGGVSSIRSKEANLEIVEIARNNLSLRVAAVICAQIFLKGLLSRVFRRVFKHLLFKRIF